MPRPDETPTPDVETTEEHEPVVASDDEPETPEIEATADEQTDDGEFRNLTPREKALVQRARVQEKRKLYEDIKQLKLKLRNLEDTQRRAAEDELPKKKRGKDDDGDDIREMIRELRTEITEKERKNELRSYRRDRIAEARHNGERIIEALVMGDTEEDIDASLEVAKAEAAYMYSEAERELQRTNGDDNGSRRTTVVVRDSPRRPRGVPQTVNGPGSGDDQNTISLKDLKKLSSMDSVRDGTYAANRKKIHEALIEGRIRQ
jgi:hypothetical protein